MKSLLFKLYKLKIQTLYRLRKKTALEILFQIFSRPKKHNMPERELQFYNLATKKSYAFENETVRIYEWNLQEKNIILVHGWEGRACQLGEFIERFNSAGYGVLSFDAIAHGESSGQMTSLFQNARLVKSLMNQYQVHIAIAHSFGSITCLAAIKFLKVPIHQLICLGSPFHLEWIFTSFTQHFNLPKSAGKELINYIIEKFNLNKNYADLNSDPSLTSELLIFHDKFDKEVPFQQAIDLANSWKNSQLVLSEHLGHRRILRDPSIIESSLKFITNSKEFTLK